MDQSNVFCRDIYYVLVGMVDEGVLKDRSTDAKSGNDRFLLVPFADSGSRVREFAVSSGRSCLRIVCLRAYVRHILTCLVICNAFH